MARAIRRSRPGLPDVFLQEPKQREDELTAETVKNGFTFKPVEGPMEHEGFKVHDAFRNTDQGILEFFQNILLKKEENHMMNDSTKRKQLPVNKSNFWPLMGTRTARPFEQWLSSLASSEPLGKLAKAVPIVLKREDVFQHLFDHNVATIRACWYIKMLASYNSTSNDSKPKKKHTPTDPCIEWTKTTITILEEVFDRLIRESALSQRNTPIPELSTNHLNDLSTDPHNLVLTTGSATPQYGPSTPQMHHASPSVAVSSDKTRRQWEYYNRLLRLLFDQGLLDRHTIVEWLVEVFIGRLKNNDDINLRYIIPIMFQYSSEILEYEIFSRKISFYCCKRLGQYHVDTSQSVNFSNLISCPQHRMIIYSLSAIVQCITLRCPAALLYNNPIDPHQKPDVILLNSGSPLDYLPCSPSQLPMPPGVDSSLVKQMLIQAEDEIRSRSLAIEHKWSTEKLQQSISGQTISRVLAVLEILDELKEDKYLLESAYNRIYGNTPKLESLTNEIEIEVIHLMCDWAITTRRHGVYRAVFIARLLERRQNDLKNQRNLEVNENSEDKETSNSPMNLNYCFQSALNDYLLKKAPYIDTSQANDSQLSTSFASLVMLFSEFIRLNIFSPMQFMCNLVAHGLLPSNNDNHENHSIAHKPYGYGNVYNPMGRPEQPISLDNSFDRRVSTTWNDFDPLESMNASPSTTPKTFVRQSSKIDVTRCQPISSDESIIQQRNRKRCILYLEQFPYPLEKDYRDDFNQRKILLYGITRKRDEAKRQLKKNIRELASLFKKNNCLDIKTENTPFNRPVPYEHHFQIRKSILSLSYHDQYYVTNRASKILIARFTSFIEERTTCLPWLDGVAFLFELMEKSLNLNGLIQTCIDVLRIFSRIETIASLKTSPGMYSYRYELYLEITSIFRLYIPVLILTPANMIQVFENLLQITQQIQDPVRTTSVERALLMLMYDSYNSCSYLKSKYTERVPQMMALIKKDLYSQTSQNNKQDATIGNCQLDSQASLHLIEDPRKALTKFQNERDRLFYLKQIDESPQTRASFVINTLFAVSKAKSWTYIHDMGHLATELTCQIASLSPVWLQAIKTLSSSATSPRGNTTPNHSNVFEELRRIDAHDLYVHDNLSVFISIMIARHALSINDYIIVSVQSILASTPKERLDPLGSRGNPSSTRIRGSPTEEANEPGTRFTCDVIEHLLSAHHIPWIMMIASRERRLLASNYRNVAFGAFLCVLKSLLIISQSCFKDCKTYFELCRESTQRHAKTFNFDRISPGEQHFRPYREPIPEELVDLSMRVLKLCCDQDWIQERCLKESDTLCNQTNLCDKLLDDGQAQQLLRFICYKSTSELTRFSLDKGPKPIISSLLQNLNQWTLRATILELKLMIKILEYNTPGTKSQDANFNYSSAMKTHEHNTQHLLHSIASATIELFQHQTEGRYATSSNSITSSSSTMSVPQTGEQEDRKGIWLIAPLISRLPDNVQSKILQIAGSVLENGNSMLNSSKTKVDKENQVLRSISLLSHQPFLSLVLSCLKDQDEQRIGLLDSLRGQLEQLYKQDCEHCSTPGKNFSNMLSTAKPTGSSSGLGSGGSYPDCRCNCHKTDWQIHSNNLAPIVQDDPNMKMIIFESLQLRLSLIGGMFDTIIRNVNSIPDWVSVFSQLIASGVIDTKNNAPLLNTVLDMLGVIIHNIVPSEGSIETNRVYMTIVRRVRKEIGERRSEALDEVKRFLPLQKPSLDIYVVEPFDGISNRLLNPEMKKHGLQVARKEKINSWEVIEGSKSAASVCYSWFCAKKTERKRLRYEEQYRLLLRHKHNIFDKRITYFRDPPDIPAEAPEHADVVIVGANKPPIHSSQMPSGHNSYNSLQQMHGHPMSIGAPNMNEHQGKPTSVMMAGPGGVRGSAVPRVRPQNPVQAPGTSKRVPRLPRSTTPRPTAMQPNPSTTPAMYNTQTNVAPHTMYSPAGYAQWMPGPTQPSMVPAYQQNSSMPKQPTSIPTARAPSGVPTRPTVAYSNQPMAPVQSQQPLPQHHSQSGPVQGQMPVGYAPDQSAMMMASNPTRSVLTSSGKRKLGDANMYPNEQTSYTTPAKMSGQPGGPMTQYQQASVMMSNNNYMSQAGQQQQQQQPGQQTSVQQQQQQQQQQSIQQQTHSQMYPPGSMSSAPYMNNQMIGNPTGMMQQSGPVYQPIMNNPQQGVYNPTAGNPNLNRTPSQTPMSVSNPQWPNNQTMNMARQSQNPYNPRMQPEPQQHYVTQQQQQHYQ